MLLSAFDRRDFENRTALIFLDRHLSYGEIAAEGWRVAAGLQSLGISKGDRVAIHMRNGPQLLASIIGCWRIGAIAVPIRPWQAPAKIVAWCGYLGVVCLLVDELLVEKVRPHVSELTTCRAVVSTGSVPRTDCIQPWSALFDNDGGHARIAAD